MRRSRAIVSGRVQAVGFRWACVQRAEQAGVRGWVRNLSDGTLEVVVESADDDAVDAVLRWLHDGPPGARVDHVAIRDEEPLGEQGFRVR